MEIFARWTLVPRLEHMRSEINHKLLPRLDNGTDVFAHFESPIPDDEEADLEIMKVRPEAMTVNEYRARLELPPVENGDKHLVATNLVATDLDGLFSPGGSGHLDEDEKKRRGYPAKYEVKQEGTPNQTVEEIIKRMEARTLTVPTRDLWDKELKDWADNTSAELGVEPTFDILNPLAAEHLEQLSSSPQHLGGVDTETRTQLRSVLTEGFEAGEAPREIAKRIRQTFSFADKVRAERIARTEVLRSSNFGTWQAHAASGLIQKRQWVGTPDDRTRDEHKPGVKGSLHGQIVNISDPFTIMLPGSEDIGATAMHPGGFNVPSDFLLTHVEIRALGTQEVQDEASSRCWTKAASPLPNKSRQLTGHSEIQSTHGIVWP